MVRKPAPAVAQGTSGSFARLSGIDPPGFMANARTENQQVTVVPCKFRQPPRAAALTRREQARVCGARAADRVDGGRSGRRVTKSSLYQSMDCRFVPGERGRPARTSGRRPTRVLKRARCPRSQGKRPCGTALPGSAGVPPARGPMAHPWVQAGKMPALPGKAPLRNGSSWERGRPARTWAEGPPVGSSGQACPRMGEAGDARDPRERHHMPRRSAQPR